MRAALGPCVVLAIAGCAPAAPAPAHPPGAVPQVLAFSVITVGRPAGNGEIRIEADGTRHSHVTFNDRGRGPDLHTTMAIDATGLPRSLRVTGHDYLKAAVDERLDERDGTLRWQSSGEHGQAPAGAGFYAPLNGGFDGGVLAQALLRAPDHRIKLLPTGEAWIEDDTARDVEIAGTKRHLRRLAIAGVGFEPSLQWFDDHDEMFATVSPWISIVRTGAEAVIPTLVGDDSVWTAARAGKLAAKLAHRPPAAGLAITHARLYDSVRRIIVPDATVIVVGDRITAVGDATTPVPPGARVVDAQGRTLIPGLWDMHVHESPGDGILQLATGVTTVRDLANDLDTLAARVQRFDAGTELGPHVLRAGLIDGPGPFTAPTGVVASTAEEALAEVTRFAEAGYVQIKLYSSLSPALVPVIAAATHARGLRLSGHIPTGMTAAEAVEAGYDEIQHVNFLVLQFLAKRTDDTRTPLRFTMVAEHAADLDLQGPEVQHFLDLLVAHRTVIDPTLAVFDQMFTSAPGELDPILVPYAGRLPAQIERTARGGSLPAPGAKRAQFRASFAQLLRLVKLAWDRKIPIVAGTDTIAGLTVSHELELYVRAGIPPADVLSLATIGAARVMGIDHDTGSIDVGKRADLVLVDGDPTRDIAAVRNTDVVVCRGVVYDPAELFAAVGMRAR